LLQAFQGKIVSQFIQRLSMMQPFSLKGE
jgi:hypothetical protein